MGLVNFAFEEDEVVADAAVEANPVAEVVEASADASVDAGEIAQVQEMVDTGIAEAGNLETVGDAVADTLEEGGEGLSPDAATQVEISVESICARLGMKNTSTLSVESFKSTASRRQATKLSLEGIWDKLKKVWEAIKKTLANLWERIKLWFGKMNLVASTMGKSAVDLIAKLNGKKNGKKEKATIALKSVAAAFSEGGKCGVKQITAILEGNKKQLEEVQAFVTKIDGGALGLNNKVNDLVNSILQKGNLEVKGLDKFPGISELQSTFGTAKFVRGITGKVVSEFKDGKLSAKFETQIPSKFEVATEVSVCSVAEAIAMAELVRQISIQIKESSSFDKDIGKFKKTAEACITDMQKLIDSASKKEASAKEGDASNAAKEHAAAKVFSIAQNQITVVTALATSINTKVLDYAKNAVTEALVYGYAVEAQYKDAE